MEPLRTNLENRVPHSSAHGRWADIREQWGLQLREVPSTAGDDAASQVLGVEEDRPGL